VFTRDSSRPITLLPVLNRLYQKTNRKSITRSINKDIPKNQYGFQENRSVACAVNHFVHEFNSAKESGHKII
jgi:hypothetical protein